MSRKPTPATVLDDVLTFEAAGSGTLRVPLDRIVDNPYQYRQHYDAAGIAELATNINALAFQLPETSGLQSPPMGRLVRLDPVTGGIVPVNERSAEAAMRRDPQVRVQLAFGHRRLRAFQVLANGLRSVFPDAAADLSAPAPSDDYGSMPVTLTAIDDQGMAEYALTENSQRQDVSAIEEASLLQRMIDEFGLSQKDVGRKFGWSESTVSNKLRLLRLPADVANLVRTGQLSERHGRELVRLADAPARLAKMAERAKDKDMTVRQLAENVKWELDSEAKDVARRQQIDAARAVLTDGYEVNGATLGPERIYEGQDSWRVTSFQQNDKRLVHGLCSGNCPCMCFTHNLYPAGYSVPLSAELPNMVLGCSDRERWNQVGKAAEELETTSPDAQEAAAALAAEAHRKYQEENAAREALHEAREREAEAIWQAALPDIDRFTLWTNIEFWRYMFASGGVQPWWLQQQIKKTMNTISLVDEILEQIKGQQREYQQDTNRTSYNVEKVRKAVKLINEFSRGGSRKKAKQAEPEPEPAEEPGGVVSGWMNGWDNDDEASYQNVMAEWDGNWRHLDIATAGELREDVTKRTMQRLIEACPDIQVRGDLWRMYNARYNPVTFSRENSAEGKSED